jgi:Holliday junction DNA helicase RuvA
VRQDAKWLSTLPGIGATTAEQIVTTLKRKVMPFTVASTAEPSATAQADPAAPAVDSKLIEDIYLALMGLGLAPAEARNKLDALLTSGKPFTSVQSGLSLVFTKSSG